MARTELAFQDVPGPFMTSGVITVWTAADVANGNMFPLREECVLLVRNTGGSAYNVTITSVAAPTGRTGNITDSIAAGGYRFYGPFTKTGWMQEDGSVYVSGANVAIEFAVFRTMEWAKTS